MKQDVKKIKSLVYSLFFCVLILTIPVISFSQSKTDNLVKRLNIFYKSNRVLFSGKVQEIYLNRGNRTLEIDNIVIPLNNFSATYKNSYNPYHKKNMHTANLACLEGNCFFKNKDQEFISGTGLFFKTKNACFDFINIIDEIKESF